MGIIQGRKPQSVFRYFEEISRIPRGSYHEEAIAEYLVNFAKARGLFCYRDQSNNVLIKAPASEGREKDAPILFQGHTDMVCEKNADVPHDFLTDPIELVVEGDFLRANGTTLGGDDGIAVAIMLALLDGEVSSHPAYECLFTTAEEVGLDGAKSFDYGQLGTSRMVNLDSEELGVITAGCAGGIRTDLDLFYQADIFEGQAMRVSVRGLCGGHSGENINAGRANANKVMGRLLAALTQKTDARLISLEGGSKDNAIPRECDAVLAVPDFDKAEEILTDVASGIAVELIEKDRAFSVTCESADSSGVMLSEIDTLRAVAILSCAANGVFEMNRNVKGLVEFSRNLGVVHTDAQKIRFVFSTRSSMETRLDASINELNALGKVTGCKTNHHSRYPGWDYAAASPIREAYLKAYEKVTGESAIVNVIHAGLECGIIRSKVPQMDMISVGPSMLDIHSPDEKLNLPSVETFFETLRTLIADL